jgi:hypothetical protein
MEVSTRQLRAFRLAAQHQSFARAAEALFITPSGLSMLIAYSGPSWSRFPAYREREFQGNVNMIPA